MYILLIFAITDYSVTQWINKGPAVMINSEICYTVGRYINIED